MNTRRSASAVKPSSLNLIDTHSLFRVAERLRADGGKLPSVDYARLLSILESVRHGHGLRASEQTLAPAAIDLRSESQQRFVQAIGKLGIVVDAIDYRHTFVSAIGDDRESRSPATLAPYLAYIAGLIAERKEPELVIVSAAFDLYLPLQDFVSRRGGKVVLVFFRQFLDRRWAEMAQLFAADSAIEFHDLEQDAESLLGIQLDDGSSEKVGDAPTGLGLI